MKDTPVVTIKNVILSPRGFPFIDSGNNWEGRWVYHPQIIQKNKQFFMFYSGKSGFSMKHSIGFATSNDAVEWSRFASNPCLVPSENKNIWDSDLVAHGFIFEKEDEYFMFYDGSPKTHWQEGIGIAKSRDLIHWKKIKENPVLKAGDFWWDKDHVSRCCVIPGKDKYFYMYYAGHDHICERIGLARSKDLLTWEKFIQEPILNLGEKDTWDEKHISDPRIIKVSQYYLMTYTGYDKKGKGSIGIAFSTDLHEWIKMTGNPILTFGKEGSWNADETGRGEIAEIGPTYYLYFSGRKGFYFRIGYGIVNMEQIISNIKKQSNGKRS